MNEEQGYADEGKYSLLPTLPPSLTLHLPSDYSSERRGRMKVRKWTIKGKGKERRSLSAFSPPQFLRLEASLLIEELPRVQVTSCLNRAAAQGQDLIVRR